MNALSAGLLVFVLGQSGRPAPPTVPETLEFLKDRVTGATSGEWTQDLFAPEGVANKVVGYSRGVRNYHLSTRVLPGKAAEPGKTPAVRYVLHVKVENTFVSKRTVPLPPRPADALPFVRQEDNAQFPQPTTSASMVLLDNLDPDGVTVSRRVGVDGHELTSPVFELSARPLDAKNATFTLWLSDERTAQAAAKALRHALRELNGRPVVKRSTVDYFEGGPPAAVSSPDAPRRVAAVPPPAAAAAPPPETPKPANNDERVAARKRVEQALVDAEAELVRAMKQDAENKAANDAKRAALRAQLDGLNADARKARADGQNAKATVAFTASLVVLADLNDEFKWAKDTGAAARAQARIATLRKQLIDLKD